VLATSNGQSGKSRRLGSTSTGSRSNSAASMRLGSDNFAVIVSVSVVLLFGIMGPVW
jgi:hypothetical protein